MAKTSSQDEASRQQGGELAPVTRGKKGDAWDKVAFALAPGETGLAQTDKGYHVILMEGVEKREPLPEAESQARATQKVKEAKSQELARDEAKQLQSDVVTTSFTEAAKKANSPPRKRRCSPRRSPSPA